MYLRSNFHKYTFYSYQVLIDSDREKNSASNESIFDESKSDIHGSLGQKLVFRAPRECFRSLLLSNEFKKIM
jgi:hypothetical protein